jgi:hypothetical protein
MIKTSDKPERGIEVLPQTAGLRGVGRSGMPRVIFPVQPCLEKRDARCQD